MNQLIQHEVRTEPDAVIEIANKKSGKKTSPKAIIDTSFNTAEAMGGFNVDKQQYLVNGEIITLVFKFLPNQVEIIDQDNPHFQLSASIQRDNQGKKVMTMRLYTDIYNGIPGHKHPLLYAGYFSDRCYQFFKDHKQEPDIFEAAFPKHGSLKSVNYSQYESNRREGGMSDKDAVNGTWAGKLANKFGFNSVVIEETDDDLIAWYTRNEK